MVISDLSMVQLEGTPVVEWRSAEMNSGALFVMIRGTTLMPV